MREVHRQPALAVTAASVLTHNLAAADARDAMTPRSSCWGCKLVFPRHYQELLNLPQVGLNNILTSLKSPATLFAPNNEAFALYAIGSNVSNAEALKSPLLATGVNLLVVPEALLNTSDFHDGESLPTFVKGQNLTVVYQQVNTTQLVIYGITGAFVPQQNIQVQNQGTPGAVHNITQYIETVLIPGGPVTSLNAVLTAANQGQLDQVAAAFNTAVAHNYTNQLIDVVKEAIGVPDAIPTLAKIANEMIIQTNCSALQPLFHDLYPAMYSSPQSLDLNMSQLSAIPAEAPRLAQCALKGT
ncbi:MAG: hypothetical protein FRX49_07827 [Trebouxia sp. A1-2]|nr:MAG: hypothetical protein FRX49_07827 [Trebouxia sp. A1-2]